MSILPKCAPNFIRPGSQTYGSQRRFAASNRSLFSLPANSISVNAMLLPAKVRMMGRLFHLLANHAARLLMKAIFGCVARVRVLRSKNANYPGGFLLAANHISHFDPFIISAVVGRKIDWMAMAEFFPNPFFGAFLRAVDAFPAERNRADRATIRTAMERLKEGRMVGIFAEGGIRDGSRSVLEGAPLRPGATALAHIAGVPILPCVIVGSDRFYARKSWLPLL